METPEPTGINATSGRLARQITRRTRGPWRLGQLRDRVFRRSIDLAFFAAALTAASGCSSITGPNSWRWPWQSAPAPAPANPFIANATKPGSASTGAQNPLATAAATEWPDEKRAARDLKLALAQMLEQQGSAPEAIEAYENILRSEPNHTAVAHRLAVLLDKTGQPKRAEPYYQACLRATPADPDLLSDFAYHCYLERRWAEAESHFQRALAIDPRHVRARNNLGLVLARTERPREAFDQFAGGGCTTADAHANVAFALAAEARFDDAERVYNIALQSDPQNQRARDGLAALRQARRVAAAPRLDAPHADALHAEALSTDALSANALSVDAQRANAQRADTLRASAPATGGPVLR